MEISNEKKIDILLNLLNERYDSAHRMRERSQNFAIWILGLGIAVAWMLLDGIALSASKKIVLTLFIMVLGFIAKNFLDCIEVGFNKNREIMIRLEEILGFYKEDVYKQGVSLLPNEYKSPCNKETSHFASLARWLLTTELFLILLIWLEDIIHIAKQIICKS